MHLIDHRWAACQVLVVVALRRSSAATVELWVLALATVSSDKTDIRVAALFTVLTAA